MIVDGLAADGDGVRASVKWEDTLRGPKDLSVVGPSLTADPNGFLLLAYLPAWRAGEKRIKIDGGICPVLRANLVAASQSVARWHDMGPAPVIEAPSEIRLPSRQTAMFLSGGIDSLASLRTSQQRTPPTHPDALSAAILVAGSTSEAKFARLKQIHEEVSREAQIEAIALRTTAQDLHGNDTNFYMRIYHGAFLAGLAHLLSKRFRKVRISATYDATNLEPWGSHPLLDPFYSSAHMSIEHHGLEMSRFEKTAVVADWATGLRLMNVCTAPDAVGENCGRCEKCRRTMLALIALRKLRETDAFPSRDVRASELHDLSIDPKRYQAACYRDLIGPLRAIGRPDLATVLERKLAPVSRAQRAVRGARRALRLMSIGSPASRSTTTKLS